MSYCDLLEKEQRGEIPPFLLNAWSITSDVNPLLLAKDLGIKYQQRHRFALKLLLSGLLTLGGSIALMSIFGHQGRDTTATEGITTVLLILSGIVGFFILIGAVFTFGPIPYEEGEPVRTFIYSLDILQRSLAESAESFCQMTAQAMQEKAGQFLVARAACVLKLQEESEPGIVDPVEVEAKERFARAHQLFRSFGLITGGFKPFFDRAKQPQS